MTEPVRPVPFRAGRALSERPGHEDAPAPVTGFASASPAVLLADISEFQPDIDDAKYLAWSKAVVIRAAYGASHDDRAWAGGDRRKQLHDGGARFLGIYQYLVAGQDAAAQARELARLVGTLQPGEKIIADIEEGAGNQAARWHAWRAVIEDALGDAPWNYSGLNFAAAHGLAPVSWVAAYQQAEPAPAHQLWQFTDAFTVPGVGRADCSVFHGTIGQLAALGHAGQPVHPPATTWTATLIANLPTLSSGDTGEDVKSAQGLLGARGHPVTIDGIYGPDTRAAVTAFQHAKGIAPDGICGQDTWTKLHNR